MRAQLKVSSVAECMVGNLYIDKPPGLESKDTKLVDVVQSLGEYLTDEDATIRAKGLHSGPVTSI